MILLDLKPQRRQMTTQLRVSLRTRLSYGKPFAVHIVMKLRANFSVEYVCLLSILVVFGCHSWAGDIVSLKDWKAKGACAVALTEVSPIEPVKSTSVQEAPWLSKFIDPKIVNRADLEEMGRVEGGPFGLLSISTMAFSSSFFYVRLDRNGNLVDHVEVAGGSGGLSARDWKRISIKAKQAVRNLVAQKLAKSIDGRSGQAVLLASQDTDPTQARRFFAISNNGKYLVTYENNLIAIRDLNSAGGLNRMQFDSQGKSVWMHSVSEDGQRVIVTLRDLGDAFKATTRVLNVQSGLVEFSAEEDAMGFPHIRFFDGGYTVLNPPGASIYKNGKVAGIFPIANSTQIGACGLSCINMPREGYYNPTENEFLLFSHGPQPIKFAKGKLNIFEDVRPEGAQKKAEEATDDLLGSLASDKYTGLSEGNFSVSQNWKFAVQGRQSGSGLDLSLQNSVVLFDVNGRYLRSVSPFWSIGTISLSQDGTYLAISEQFDGPVPTLGPNKRIWIYSTSNFDFPVYTISGIELWTIDRITFSEGNSRLYVESVNNGKILEYSLIP